MDAQSPRPGRMHAEPFQFVLGESGVDFVIPGRSVPEVFSARLMDGSDTLKITWLASLGLGLLVNRIAKAEELAGGPGLFRQISGYASDALADLIRLGQFDSESVARALHRKLGGAWIVETTPRPNTFPSTWNVTASRLEH